MRTSEGKEKSLIRNIAVCKMYSMNEHAYFPFIPLVQKSMEIDD